MVLELQTKEALPCFLQKEMLSQEAIGETK
jgi:hypothetical protein